MSATSLTSKALNFLGGFFIGSPESMHMPSDFFYEKGDRGVPTVVEMQQFKTQRARLTVDAVRRGLLLRVGVFTTIAALALSIGSLFVTGAFLAGHLEYKKMTAPASTSQATPGQWKPAPNLFAPGAH